MEQTGCPYTQRSRLHAQSFSQGLIKAAPCLGNATAVSMHIGKSKRYRRRLDTPQHVAEKRFMLLRVHSTTRVRHKIAEWHG